MVVVVVDMVVVVVVDMVVVVVSFCLYRRKDNDCEGKLNQPSTICTLFAVYWVGSISLNSRCLHVYKDTNSTVEILSVEPIFFSSGSYKDY